MTVPASNYIHGTTPAEQVRLSLMNEILNPASLRELTPARGERFLDVGCGLAQLTRAIGRSTGIPVVAIDRSGQQLAEARRLAAGAGEEHLVDLRQGDAYDLPLRSEEWAAFDAAHARFILEHVRDPLAVVRQLVRAVRPGGRIILEDDDHDLLRLFPEPPGVASIWRAYWRTYDRNQNDPFIGRRLPSLLHQAGARPRRATWLFFGACAGSPLLGTCVDNLAGIFEGARDAILATGVATDLFDSALAALGDWKKRPDAFFGYAAPWVEGVRVADPEAPG